MIGRRVFRERMDKAFGRIRETERKLTGRK